ncbi:FecR domain-containing protein [Breznakiellaceae bacterium SP9]
MTAQGKSPKAQRSDRRRRALDAAVILFCLAGAAVSLNLFWRDMFQTLRMQNLVPVGTISFKYKTAQRRLSDRVLWDQLQQESPVYNGDTIRTAELSEAVLHFPDGASIDINENTLIQIQTSGDRTWVDLEDGSVSLETGSSGTSGPVLSAKGNTVEAAPGSILIAEAGEQGMSLRVSEGSVRLTDAAGESREESAGAVIRLAPTGLERSEPAAVMFTPRPNARLLNTRQVSLDTAFSWNRVNLSPEEPLRLDIAGDRNFSRIAQTIETSANAARFALPSGVWHWRITHTGAVLAAGRVTVVHAPAPSLITPSDGQVFRYRSRQPSLRFQWSGSDEAAEWILEAADNPDFANPRIRARTRMASLTTSELGAGVWYWRVLPEYARESEGTPLYSNTASFTIEQNELLEAPVPISPASGAMINIAAERRDVYFSWRSGNEAVSYTIRIAANRELQNPLIRETVRDALFVYGRMEQILGAGQYYWGISQTDADGNESPVSSARPITAFEGEVIQRTIFPPNNFTIAETLLPDTRFTWKSNLPLETRFQISNSADFSRLAVNEIVSGESFQGPSLPPGLWYWRISTAGAGLSFQTPARSFIAAPAFPAPQMLEPRSGVRVALREGERATFRWQPVRGAEYYQFRVYADTDHSRPVHEQDSVVDTVQSLMLHNFPEGDYYWTVQAFAREGPTATRLTGLIGGERFTTQKPRPLTLDSPAAGTVIEGLTALRRPVTLRWTTPEAVGNSRFILSRNANLGGTPARVIDNPGKTISLNRLEEGTWYWTVRAETADGFDISAAAPRSFRVLPISLLPETRNLLPANGYIVGPEELRQSRRLAFNWQPVEGANAYIVTLFEETGGQRRQIVSIGPQEQTSWTLEDLTLLGLGTFVWQVEAVSSTGGTVLEQRGRARESRFSVNIPAPQPVFPPNNFTIAETLLPDTRFTWRSNLPFETRFQISNSADFSRLAVNEIVSGESFQGSSLPPGLWYWRISAAGAGLSFQTPARSFITAPAFPAPQIVEPRSGVQVVLRERGRTTFRWQPVRGAEYYQFRIYADTNRSRPVHEQNSVVDTVQSLMLYDFPEGTYYWTVQAFAREGPAATRQIGLIGGERFTTRKLRPLTLDSPAAETVIEGLTALRRPVTLRWSTSEAVRNSQFILSRNANLSGTPAQLINNPSRTISLNRLEEGTWYWTVRAETTDGFDISAAAPRSFRVLPIPLLPEARNLLPANGHIVGLEELRQSRSLAFNWQPVEGANAYIFTLFEETGGQRRQIVRTGPQEQTSWTLEDLTLLGLGTFVWEVEAVSSTSSTVFEQRGKARESRFSIDISAPQAVFPPNNFTIAETLLPDTRFTWKSNLPFETRFQISNSADFSRLAVNEIVFGESFQGPSLPPGLWYWRISAAEAGLSFQTPAQSFITVPAFPAPRMIEPLSGGQVALHEGERATFRWQPVRGAEYYQLRIYADTDRSRPVHEQDSVVDTVQSLMLYDFPEGAYYWTVQAFAREGPATTQRSGLIGRERFTTRKLRSLTLDSPATGTVITGLTALRQPVTLRWSTSEAVRNSRFILSRNANLSGTPAQVIDNPGKTISLNRLGEGTWYWTVRAETTDGFDISAAAPQSFRVLPIPLLPEARNLLPANGHIVGPEELRQSRRLAFSWQPVEGANAYIITLFEETGGQRRQIVRIGPQEQTSWTLEDLALLGRGTFVWQVEAVSSTGGTVLEQRGRIGESRFSVDIPAPQPVPGGRAGTLYGK